MCVRECACVHVRECVCMCVRERVRKIREDEKKRPRAGGGRLEAPLARPGGRGAVLGAPHRGRLLAACSRSLGAREAVIGETSR